MLLMRSQTEQLTNRLCEMSFDDLYPNAQNLGAVPGGDANDNETPWGKPTARPSSCGKICRTRPASQRDHP